MPDVDEQAVLNASDIRPIMDVARATGPLAHALTAWSYEFGTRAAEPGLQLLADLDMHARRARPMHLKKGKRPSWHPLLPYCCEALPPWLKVRPDHARVPQQADYLFPSSRPGRCYTCRGTGKRTVLRREGERRFAGEAVHCHHCAGTGERWGIDRVEVHAILSGVMERAGMPERRRHPHVLRHSLITHMLDGGVSPNVVQDRVGHRVLATTLGYARFTESAAEGLEAALKKVYK